MKKYNYTQIYGIVGKILCGCSGGIIGFLAGGLGFALLGTALGLTLGHVLSKLVVKPALTNE